MGIMQAANNFLVVKKDVIEEKKSEGGIILNVSSSFTQDFVEEMENRNIVFGEVIYDNPDIPFFKMGDRIAFNPHKGQKAVIDWEDYQILNKEQVIAKVDSDGKFIVPPDSVMIKMSKERRDNLFSKWIVRDDGTKVQLFLQSEPDKNDERRSAIYVNVGEVCQVGENVKGLQENDIAILDYTVDNFTDNVLYYDDEGNKFVVIDSTTTFHTSDHWVYADRNNPRDTLVSKSGDVNVMSPILGILRNEELIAREPYCFLVHKENVVEKTSLSGIVYKEEQNVVERKVLSVSEKSNLKYGVFKGENIVMRDSDVFDIQMEGYKIQAVMDCDILLGEK